MKKELFKKGQTVYYICCGVSIGEAIIKRLQKNTMMLTNGDGYDYTIDKKELFFNIKDAKNELALTATKDDIEEMKQDLKDLKTKIKEEQNDINILEDVLERIKKEKTN